MLLRTPIFADGVTEMRALMAELNLTASRHTVLNLSISRLQSVCFALFLTKYELHSDPSRAKSKTPIASAWLDVKAKIDNKLSRC